MAGRRGGKTLWEEWEAFEAGELQGLPVGWFAPTYKILLDAWEDIQRRFGPFIRDKNESEHRLWWRSGAPLEFWSLDSGVVARSRKYGLAVVDEAGLVQNLEQRWRADIEPTLLDLDGRAIFGSTPNLVGPEFVRLFNRGVPPNAEWASFRWSSLDNPHLAGNVAERLAKLREQGVPDWLIRQEYFAEPAESDRAFFRQSDIDGHKARNARPELFRAVIDLPAEIHSQRDELIKNDRLRELRCARDGSGPWRMWTEAPDPHRAYCMGVDLSYGVGSSNTVFSVGESNGRKVAEYVYPGVTTERAARLAALAGFYWKGQHGPCLINFERNGPGEVFVHELRALNYPLIYQERVQSQKQDAGVTSNYGWRSTAESKEALLGEYRAALASDHFRNPSQSALDECLSYQYDDAMRLTAPFDRTKSKDDPARVKHGDRVIADALLYQAMRARGRSVLEDVPVFAPGTYGDIFKLAEKHPDVWGRGSAAKWLPG